MAAVSHAALAADLEQATTVHEIRAIAATIDRGITWNWIGPASVAALAEIAARRLTEIQPALAMTRHWTPRRLFRLLAAPRIRGAGPPSMLAIRDLVRAG